MATTDYIQRVPNSILNRDLTTNFGKLWSLFSEELDELNTVASGTYLKFVISSATGFSLDQIGSLVNVERETGQSDADYRVDLYSGILTFISGGSISEIIDVGYAVKSVADGGSIQVIEIFPATVQIWSNIPELIENDSEILNDSRAAGIRLLNTYSSGTDEPFVLSGDSDGLGFSDVGATGAIDPNAGVLVEFI